MDLITVVKKFYDTRPDVHLIKRKTILFLVSF